jgi:hypothetical protein
MDWHQTPIFVTNFNNLDRGFKRLLTWLRRAGYEHVAVIDNASTWPPLLEFYEHLLEVQVMRLAENLGPYAFWHLGLHTRQLVPFVVTDPDVVPAVTCPHDLVGRLHEALSTLPSSPVKVGPSLRVDNLPACYNHREEVLAWEKQFWQRPTEDGRAYEALLDTTFALYRPGSKAWPPEGTHYRLAPPYSMEHIPWYEDSVLTNAEREHYKAHARKEFVHW